MYKKYIKTATQRMRPYIPGEDMTGISVSEEDSPEFGGMVAIGDDNEARWYVSKTFFELNYKEVDGCCSYCGSKGFQLTPNGCTFCDGVE